MFLSFIPSSCSVSWTSNTISELIAHFLFAHWFFHMFCKYNIRQLARFFVVFFLFFCFCRGIFPSIVQQETAQMWEMREKCACVRACVRVCVCVCVYSTQFHSLYFRKTKLVSGSAEQDTVALLSTHVCQWCCLTVSNIGLDQYVESLSFFSAQSVAACVMKSVSTHKENEHLVYLNQCSYILLHL